MLKELVCLREREKKEEVVLSLLFFCDKLYLLGSLAYTSTSAKTR
jgi:hypothetical protein